MMTKLEERTRIKCDAYWPARVSQTETYGVMHVTLTDVQELATYTVRTFQLQRVSFKIQDSWCFWRNYLPFLRNLN